MSKTLQGHRTTLYSKKEQALIAGGRRQTIFAVYIVGLQLRSPNEDRKTTDAQFALIRQECAVADDVPS